MLEGWQHKRLANTFQRDDDLELRHLIHGIDVVNPFALVLVTLIAYSGEREHLFWTNVNT